MTFTNAVEIECLCVIIIGRIAMLFRSFLRKVRKREFPHLFYNPIHHLKMINITFELGI